MFTTKQVMLMEYRFSSVRLAIEHGKIDKIRKEENKTETLQTNEEWLHDPIKHSILHILKKDRESMKFDGTYQSIRLIGV